MLYIAAEAAYRTNKVSCFFYIICDGFVVYNENSNPMSYRTALISTQHWSFNRIRQVALICNPSIHGSLDGRESASDKRLKLEFHGTSFPRIILVTSSRGCRACRRGCYEQGRRSLWDRGTCLWGLSPRLPTGAPPLDPAGGLPSPDHSLLLCPPNNPVRSTPLVTRMLRGNCCRGI